MAEKSQLLCLEILLSRLLWNDLIANAMLDILLASSGTWNHSPMRLGIV